MTLPLDKLAQLERLLLKLSPVAVAFSGGVDSTLLLKVAHRILKENCLAITICAPYHLKGELEDARRFCIQEQIRHIWLNLDPTTVPGLLNNPENRCYICKKALLEGCLAAIPDGCSLIDGSNLDDSTLYRPGREALQELGISSPLKQVSLTKGEIRQLSRYLNLSSWEKPAQSCLLTRLPHNQPVTEAKLEQVEQTEMAIRNLGFTTVRVRNREGVAWLELDRPEQPKELHTLLRKICQRGGFADMVIDPAGYCLK